MFSQYDDFDNDEKVTQNQKIDKYTGDRGGSCRDCLPGLKGEKGTSGQPGTPGIPGEIGRTGAKGEPGLRGDDGIPGFSGQRGEPVRTWANSRLMAALKTNSLNYCKLQLENIC